MRTFILIILMLGFVITGCEKDQMLTGSELQDNLDLQVRAKGYKIIGNARSYAHAINKNNKAVGIEYVAGLGTAAIWDTKSGTSNLLPKTSKTTGSLAWDVNDQDKTVGFIDEGNGKRAVIWESPTSSPTILPNPFVPSGSYESIAYGINNNNWVVGVFVDYGSSNFTPMAILWTDGKTPFLLSVKFSAATEINDNNEACGNLSVSGDPREQTPVKWDSNQRLIYLENSAFGNAWSINKAGEVVGQINPTGGSPYAVKWDKKNKRIVLGTLTRAVNSRAFDINDNGEIVGIINTTTGQRAVYWNNKGVIKILRNEGDDPSRGRGINNSGRVVGFVRTVPPPMPPDNDRAVYW